MHARASARTLTQRHTHSSNKRDLVVSEAACSARDLHHLETGERAGGEWKPLGSAVPKEWLYGDEG